MIDMALLAERDTGQNTPHRIHNCRNAGIRSTDKWQALFDRSGTCLNEMLIGTGDRAEPGIVRDLHEPVRAAARRLKGGGKDRLVADERQKRRQSVGTDEARARPFAEPGAGQPCKRRNAEPRDLARKRDVFAKGNEMVLVVDRLSRPRGRIEHDKGIEPRIAVRGGRTATDAENERGVGPGRRGNLALEDGDKRFSYAELDSRVRALAGLFTAHGLKRGVAGICICGGEGTAVAVELV